jgi:hypothetical protein
MESYSDRIGKFNDMIDATNEHINAIQEVATKFKDTNDPVGLGLSLTGATAGGVGGIAGAVEGLQHFSDIKKMYKGITSKLSNVRDRVNGQTPTNNGGRGGDSNNADPVQNSGSNAADENAPATTLQTQAETQTSNQVDIDGGLNDRINNLSNITNSSEEANNINRAINTKVTQTLGNDGKAILNNAVRQSGRSGDIALADVLSPESPTRSVIQQDYLKFKNNVANDAINRYNSGRPFASGYDNDGNATGDMPSNVEPNNTNAVQQTPDQSNINNVPSQNNVDLAPNPNAQNVTQTSTGDIVNTGESADANAQGIVAQGRVALARLGLTGGQQVPGSQGQAVQGLRVQMGDLDSQGVNAGARIQQVQADQSQYQLSSLQDPNSTAQSAGNQPNATSNSNAASSDLNPGQGASAGSDAADVTSDVVSSTASDVTEGLAAASGIGDVLDTAAAFSGPAAPIIGLVGGLVSLGTTIADLFHKKPPPKEEAPPPVAVTSIGGNLRDSVSGMGGGIF